MRILVLNGGSSTIKASLYDVEGSTMSCAARRPIWRVHAGWGNSNAPARIRAEGPGGTEEMELRISTAGEVAGPVLETLLKGKAQVLHAWQEISTVGHRIVHGGNRLRESAFISEEVKSGITEAAEFAPEHNWFQLETIHTAERLLGPGIPQFAVFDTAFHASLPERAFVYGGPYEWLGRGIRRYGFHGISHQYVSGRSAEILGRDVAELKLVSCHLGNGCSLAAIDGGKSIDTTMGFTPLDGLIMGTRAGSVDPGILIYLMQRGGYTADQLNRTLNKESGLKGLSGISGDMREIMAAVEAGNRRAGLAFDAYTHRLCREIGGMVASLQGMDVLAFTAGVGENSAPLREAVCERLRYLGVEIDGARNGDSPIDQDIATPQSRVRVLVIRTDEEWQIARECIRLLPSINRR
ncbi:MAG: acetate kinase [Bryobacteraceae bacterium]|nr:acetate kinase [Bryobacterales bacterium]MEB2363639.1 acetate kinase [Bryobacterales bacterium]NUM99947.1 acetate kinase [Bryobacteraceae bacterium]